MKDAIIITGASRRVGYVLAQHFAKKGENVVISYRHIYHQLTQLPKSVLQLQANFSELNNIERFVSQIKTHCESVKAVIHNASAWQAEQNADILQDSRLFQALMRIHAELPYLLNRQLFPLLHVSAQQRQATSDIIHITDFVAYKGSQKHLAYAASKAALENLTLSFAAQYAPLVKVNSIAPSLIMFNENDSAEYQQKALQKSVMQKIGGYEEMIKAVEYLFSSQYITGETIKITGGRHLK